MGRLIHDFVLSRDILQTSEQKQVLAIIRAVSLARLRSDEYTATGLASFPNLSAICSII